MSRLIVVAAIALFATFSQSHASIVVTIDKNVQRMTVIVDGNVRWTWPVSTGRKGFETPVGSYKAFRLEEDHYSKEWDDAPMPHSVFFSKEGHAIHGTYDHRRLGAPASHGCVRLSRGNAARLFALVKKHGLANTNVVIKSAEEFRPAARARQQAKSQKKQNYHYAPVWEPSHRSWNPYGYQPEFYDWQGPPRYY